MDVQQNAIDQAAIAREQINEQIKVHRKLIAEARKQVQELVDVQVTTAKEEHRKRAEEAAREAAEAQIAIREQNSIIETDSQTQLEQLILMLSEGTRINQEEVAQQTREATEAANKIINKVSQVFDSPLDEHHPDTQNES